MKSRIPQNPSIEILVKLFTDIALEQYETHFDFDTRKFNKLYW